MMIVMTSIVIYPKILIKIVFLNSVDICIVCILQDIEVSHWSNDNIECHTIKKAAIVV